jgi:hypothetical protein
MTSFFTFQMAVTAVTFCMTCLSAYWTFRALQKGQINFAMRGGGPDLIVNRKRNTIWYWFWICFYIFTTIGAAVLTTLIFMSRTPVR